MGVKIRKGWQISDVGCLMSDLDRCSVFFYSSNTLSDGQFALRVHESGCVVFKMENNKPREVVQI